MPQFDYVCVTRKGDWLEGRQEAVDKNDLTAQLLKHEWVLVSWQESFVDARSTPTVLPSSHKTITAEEGRARWASSPEAQRLVQKFEELAVYLPRLGFMGWIQKHSFGAISNPRDAFLVLVVCGGFLTSSVYLALRGSPFSSNEVRALDLPAVTQPEMSARKFNGQFRRTKTYRLDKVRAADMKQVLDHVMRQSSMTSELATTLDNALVIKATALDLELIDQLIPEVDKDYGGMSDKQMTMGMIEALSVPYNRWMNQPHPPPKLTREEEEELALEGQTP